MAKPSIQNEVPREEPTEEIMRPLPTPTPRQVATVDENPVVTDVKPEQLRERINEFSFHDAGLLRIGVVQGYETEDGDFHPLPGQMSKTYQIQFEDFETFLASQGVAEALRVIRLAAWPLVRVCRAGRDATTLRQLGNMNR